MAGIPNPLYQVFPLSRGNVLHGPVLSMGVARLPEDSIGAADLTLEGLQAGSDILVLRAGTTTVEHEVDAHSGSTYVYNYPVYAPPRTVDLCVFKTGFKPFYVRNFTLLPGGGLLPIAQVPDRDYSNPI